MNDYGISKLDLKRRNRMQILRVMGPFLVWIFLLCYILQEPQ